MANKMRKCLCCGKEYSYCHTCKKDRNKPAFMAMYCGENCCKIFDAVNNFNFNLISDSEAKEIINACDLSEIESFNEIVKNDINAILDMEKEIVEEKPKKATKKAVKDEAAK